MGSTMASGRQSITGSVNSSGPVPSGATIKFAINATASASDQTLFTCTAGKTAYILKVIAIRSSAGDLQPLIIKDHAAAEITRVYSALGQPNEWSAFGAVVATVAASETLKINNANQAMNTMVVYYEV